MRITKQLTKSNGWHSVPEMEALALDNVLDSVDAAEHDRAVTSLHCGGCEHAAKSCRNCVAQTGVHGLCPAIHGAAKHQKACHRLARDVRET